MFRSAYLRLTLWYLAIIMLISVIFSVALYGVLTNELDRGLRRQALLYRPLPFLGTNDDSNTNQVQAQIDESHQRIQLNLVYFNILILVLAGGSSYFLAKRTLKPIKEALDSQSRFTADASHELRTPLTAMKTEIEVTLREKTINQTETRSLLKSSLEEIKKLEELSNALLILSQTQNGSSKTSFEEISLENIINESVTGVQSLAKAKKITIKTEIIEANLEADKSSLVSLIKILLDNAIKYSPENAEIKISNEIEDNFVRLSIADKGIGIKASDLPHIFDRFYRADLSRSSQNVSGYGLGLSIAKKIVENHQGKIDVESSPSKGSVFTIKLPLKHSKGVLSNFSV